MALGLLVAPAALIFPRLAPEHGDPRAPLDPPGIALLAVAVGGLVLIVNRLPLLGLGTTIFTIGTITALAWAALVARSRRHREPALPLRELADPVLRRAMLAAAWARQRSRDPVRAHRRSARPRHRAVPAGLFLRWRSSSGLFGSQRVVSERIG
jgi:hypothetical protein